VIKSDPDKRDISVVMISADTNADKVSQCIELGADDYLPKPFNPTILRARIGAALRRHSLRALENEYLGKIENEKRHSENLLRNILPAEIVTRLRNGESNIADHFDDATVIFADVVGFGKITARMKAYEIVACLNELFSEFDKLAEDVGIEKIKTIGDSYMAVCGLPTPRSHHPRMAAKFALDMVAATVRLRSRLPVPFTIRVGLHSGPVMAGVIGARKFAYDVWGDTVNIAARLEAASQPNRVLASAATVKKAGERLRFRRPAQDRHQGRPHAGGVLRKPSSLTMSHISRSRSYLSMASTRLGHGRHYPARVAGARDPFQASSRLPYGRFPSAWSGRAGGAS